MKEKIIDIEDFTRDKQDKYSVRETVRGIIFNDKNEVALIYAENYNHYLLPGGGIENNESKEEAVKREVLEETGLVIKNLKEVLKIKEIQRFKERIQNSHCYIGELEKVVEPKLEENEKEAGYKLKWFSLEDAIKVLKKDTYSNIPGKYSYLRNLIILKEVIRERE